MLRTWLRNGVSIAIASLNLLALTGFVVRDLNAGLALLLYLPLLPLGIVALLGDLLRRGRSVGSRPFRFSMAMLGLVSIACSLFTMLGQGPDPASSSSELEIRVLQWNTYWGGWPRTASDWTSIEEAILQRRPDIVVLSEPPPLPRLNRLQARLGANWSSLKKEHGVKSEGRFSFVVLSRWPVHEGRIIEVRNGKAMDAQITLPDREIRLLVVDGLSKISRSRTPFLLNLAETCQRAFDSGKPFDLVLGDFNAVSRSLGFDALQKAGEGYKLASWSCQGWRGTWPWPLPVFDIDHVWVREGWRVVSCAIFSDKRSDHRGEVVSLRFPGWVC